MSTWCLGLLLLLPGQDPPVRDLVERLRADSPDARHQAFLRLRSVGPAVESDLRIAAGDPDSEVAARSRALLRSVDLRRSLSPRILQEFPDLPERVAENPAVWAAVFQEAACWSSEEQARHPRLTEPDLDALAIQALGRAQTCQEFQSVLQVVGWRRLRGVLPAIRPLLDHPDFGIRRLALHSLQNFRDRDALEPIAGLLEDPSLRNEAAWTLGYFRRAGVLPAIRPYLNHPEAAVRSSALLTLRNMDCPDAASLVRSKLQDPDHGIRYQSMQILVRLCGALEALPDLQRFLRDGDLESQVAALSALQSRSMPEAWPVLRPLLRSDHSDVKIQTIRYILDARCLDAKDDLVELLQDPSPDVRGSAAETLAQLRLHEATPELLRLLSDPSDRVRESSLWGLITLGCRDLLPRLIERLRDPDLRTRGCTLSWLDGRCWKEAGPEVARLLEDPEGRIRIEAIQTLPRIGARLQAGRLLELLLKPHDPETEAAVEVLQRWDLPELRPRLIELAAHKDADVRRLAADLLARQDAVEAAPTLLKLLEDPDQEVRDAAIQGVRRQNLRQAIPVLRQLLADPARGNCRGAALALCALKEWDCLGDMMEALAATEDLYTLIEEIGELGSPELIAPLEPLLDSDDRRVRQTTLNLFRRLHHPLATEALRRVMRLGGHPLQTSAIYALGQFEDRESLPDLLHLLDASSAGVRASAAHALANLGAREAIPLLMPQFLEGRSGPRSNLLSALSRLGAPGLAPHVLSGLRSDRPELVAEAVHAAEALHLNEARPDLIRLSQDDDLTLRPLASVALIRLGDRGEIPSFLQRDCRSLHLLNQFRRPELWERLRTTPLPRAYRGTYGQVLAEFAVDAGLALEVHVNEEFLAQDLGESILRRNGLATLLDALDDLFEGRHVSFILERDRLHLLPTDDAERFWTHWWKQQGCR